MAGTVLGLGVIWASLPRGGYFVLFDSDAVYAGLCLFPFVGLLTGAGIGWAIKESP